MTSPSRDVQPITNADTTTIEHPSWCSTKDCQLASSEGKAHFSRPVRARSYRTDLDVTVQLLQYQPREGYPDSGQPFVSLVARFPDYGPDYPAEEIPLCFDAGHARTVGGILLNIARQALDPAL